MPPAIKKQETQFEEPMTPEQAKKYDSLIGRYFIRVEPETRKPWPEAKEFFYSITHHFKSTVNHGAGFRIMFQIQKLYRDKTVEVDQRQANGQTVKVKKHIPWRQMSINEEGQEELYSTGDRLIDAELFTKQFAIDKSAPEESPLMDEVNAFEEVAPAT